MTTPFDGHYLTDPNHGIPVQVNRVQQENVSNLKALARGGNYWAMMIVKDIESLASGHIKPNVYVVSEASNKRLGDYRMILPGCMASVLKRKNGNYLVYDMKLDVNYYKLQQQSKKPGLHHVKKEQGNFTAHYKKDGRLTATNNPVVAVSDGGMMLSDAMVSCSSHLSESPLIGSLALERDGFDMHYTPGKKIGGLLQINQALNAATDASLHESALLLARTMEQAKNTKDVLWLSQAGGSGVLTQAMHILNTRRVTFKDSEHFVYFSHLTTSYVKAQALAMQLGLKFDRDNKSSGGVGFAELVGGLNFAGDFVAGYQRMRTDPEYNALNYGTDALKGVCTNWKAVGALSACGAAISVATGMGAVPVIIPAVMTAATAAAGLGNTLFQAWLPEKYRRLKQKL